MNKPASILRELSVRDNLGNFLNGIGLTGSGVEVGTLHGSYAQLILNQWKGHLFCVDPWINQPEELYHDSANKLDMDAVFRRTTVRLGSNPKCTLVRKMGVEAAKDFEDGSLSFVYLDANHSVDAVYDDIAAWWPKVKIGGLLCGHDCNTRYDSETNSDALTAVMDFAEAINTRPHVTWCTSWWFIKTEEADKKLKDARKNGTYMHPFYSDNRNTDLVVILPVAEFDWHLAKKWLAFTKQLSPEVPIIALVTPKLSEAKRQELVGATVVECVGLKDGGYYSAPNQVIKYALEYVERGHPGKAMLWCEADTVPMRPTWFQEIRDEYRKCDRPFMGDFHLKGAIAHMTGVAVYSPDWRKWSPALGKLPGPNLAQGWDSQCAYETLPRAHRATTIQQIWRPPLPITEAYAKAAIRAETALFHQCKDSSLVDVLCRRYGFPAIPLDAPLAKSNYETVVQPKPKAVVRPVVVAAPIPVQPEIRPKLEPTESGVEILIVTHAKDKEFLRYCLRSIERYAVGFSGVTLMVPSSEVDQFRWVNGSVNLRYFDQEKDKGFLRHEILECSADLLCPKATHILHLDADCMFWSRVAPEDYLPGGKALMVRERYSDIATRNRNRLIWGQCVKVATGIIPEYETMTRHPQIHPREVYAKTREAVEAFTKIPFERYVLGQKNRFPQGFAEYDTIGAVAIKYFSDRYCFVDYDRAKDAAECGVDSKINWQYLYRPIRDKLVEFWSYGGIDRYKDDAARFLRGELPTHYVK